MSEVKNLVEIRYKVLEEDISDRWLWPKSDTGAWEGPFTDWQNSHRFRYFEHIKNYNCVITAGANAGAYTRAYSIRFKKVYAFEPNWLNFYCLSYNNPSENVFAFHAGLGEECGTCKIVNENKSNMGALRAEGCQGGDIPMLSIDSLKVNECDLIQLDVEGYELNVLKGAKETIKKFRPVVVCERDHSAVTDLLSDLGYIKVGKSVADIVYKPK